MKAFFSNLNSPLSSKPTSLSLSARTPTAISDYGLGGAAANFLNYSNQALLDTLEQQGSYNNLAEQALISSTNSAGLEINNATSQIISRNFPQTQQGLAALDQQAALLGFSTPKGGYAQNQAALEYNQRVAQNNSAFISSANQAKESLKERNQFIDFIIDQNKPRVRSLAETKLELNSILNSAAFKGAASQAKTRTGELVRKNGVTSFVLNPIEGRLTEGNLESAQLVMKANELLQETRFRELNGNQAFVADRTQSSNIYDLLGVSPTGGKIQVGSKQVSVADLGIDPTTGHMASLDQGSLGRVLKSSSYGSTLDNKYKPLMDTFDAEKLKHVDKLNGINQQLINFQNASLGADVRNTKQRQLLSAADALISAFDVNPESLLGRAKINDTGEGIPSMGQLGSGGVALGGGKGLTKSIGANLSPDISFNGFIKGLKNKGLDFNSLVDNPYLTAFEQLEPAVLFNESLDKTSSSYNPEARASDNPGNTAYDSVVMSQFFNRQILDNLNSVYNQLDPQYKQTLTPIVDKINTLGQKYVEMSPTVAPHFGTSKTLERTIKAATYYESLLRQGGGTSKYVGITDSDGRTKTYLRSTMEAEYNKLNTRLEQELNDIPGLRNGNLIQNIALAIYGERVPDLADQAANSPYLEKAFSFFEDEIREDYKSFTTAIKQASETMPELKKILPKSTINNEVVSKALEGLDTTFEQEYQNFINNNLQQGQNIEYDDAATTQQKQQDAMETLRNTPGYQFAFQEGARAVERGAASKGGLLSGGTLNALTQFGQNLATSTLQNQLGQLQGVINTGMQAQGSSNNANAAQGSQLSGLLSSLGLNQANLANNSGALLGQLQQQNLGSLGTLLGQRLAAETSSNNLGASLKSQENIAKINANTSVLNNLLSSGTQQLLGGL